MKKLIIALVAVVATCLSGQAQISLSDAYTSLVNMPGMVEKNVGTVQMTPETAITNLQSVSYKNQRYATEFMYTYESLPIQNMLLGANNQSEMACVFTEPSTDGVYNLLFLIGEKGGPYVACYGQTDAAGLDVIRSAQVSLQGNQMVLAASPQVEFVELFSFVVRE